MIKSKWCKRTLVPLALLTAATMFTVATGNTLLTVAEAASGETSKYYSDYDSMEDAHHRVQRPFYEGHGTIFHQREEKRESMTV